MVAQSVAQPVAQSSPRLAKVATTSGCSDSDWRSVLGVDELWIDQRESHVDPEDVNPRSGALGLGQLLPSTYRGYDLGPVSYSPCAEITAQRGYMAKRYGSWSAARSFWEHHYWW